MLYLDNRDGSSPLLPHLRARGLAVTLTRLQFGDVSFIGSGADGEPVSVGIEVKTLRDVLKCVCDGRFAGHQLPGLVQSYDQVWLLVEGIWRAHPRTGILQYLRGRGSWTDAAVGSRKFMYRDLLLWLLTVQIKGGMSIHTSSNWGEAITFLSSLYSWWTTGEGYDSHKSHLAINSSSRGQFFDRALLVRPTTCRLVAAQLPGIGFEKSIAVSIRFPTVAGLVAATVDEIAEVTGVGKKLAQTIYAALRSNK